MWTYRGHTLIRVGWMCVEIWFRGERVAVECCAEHAQLAVDKVLGVPRG